MESGDKEKALEMTCCCWRESLESLLGNFIATEKSQELEKNKADIEDKVTKILKLINEEELVTLIEDFHKQYQSLYTLYNLLTGELRKEIHYKEGLYEGSYSESEHSSEEKGSKNQKWDNDLQMLTEVAVDELDSRRNNEQLVNEELVLEVENRSLKQQLEAIKEENEVKERKFQLERDELNLQNLRLINAIDSEVSDLKEIEATLNNMTDKLSQHGLVVQKIIPTIKKLNDENSTLKIRNGILKRQLESLNQQVVDLKWAQGVMEKDNEVKEKKFQRQRDQFKAQLCNLTNRISSELENLMEIKDSLVNMELSELELVVQESMVHHKSFKNIISGVSKELRIVKNWVSMMVNEKQMLQKKVCKLHEVLSGKNEYLREVEGEKSVLIEKVGQLEKEIEEKEKQRVGCVEEKKEAIRQLCSCIDYHRERCVQLKEILISKMLNRKTDGQLETDFYLFPSVEKF